MVPTDFALELALQHEVNRARVERADLVRYFKELSRVDPLLFVRMLASAGETDSTDHLPAVDVPTLVLAGESDTFTPVRLSEALHQEIRGSELHVIRHGTHVTPLEFPAAVARHVRAFLSRLPESPARLPPARRPGALRAPRRAASREGS